MPIATETRTLSMPAGEVWQLVCDPYHLPRWWPRVERVEAVSGPLFTQVMRSSSGRLVRVDFERTEHDEAQMRLVWAQQIAGTPFARVLSASEITVQVRPRMGMNESAGSDVTLTLSQTLPRWFAGPQATRGAGPEGGSVLSSSLARLGSPMIRKAAVKTVKEALDGLQRIAG